MDIKNTELKGAIQFPCHSKEKLLVYSGADGYCSAKCPSCDKFALFDFSTMKSIPTKAARGAVHKLTNKSSYID